VANEDKVPPGSPGSLVSVIRQADVYWVDFGPVGGSAPAERHPCVVVQNDVFNQSLIATTEVCLITSNLSRARAPGNVALRKGEANLPKPSVVNVSQILTIDKSELVGQVGRASASTADAIRSGLQLLFERAR
jgi:mRNA interferase MazF